MVLIAKKSAQNHPGKGLDPSPQKGQCLNNAIILFGNASLNIIIESTWEISCSVETNSLDTTHGKKITYHFDPIQRRPQRKL